MHWEATDQFGNLFVAHSAATDFGSLAPEIDSILDELASRNPDGFRLTFDFEYGEINGPDPDQVSHVIRTEWLPSQATDTPFWEEVLAHVQASPAVGVKISRA